MRDNTGVHYILADHLGSSTMVTNGGGGVQGTMKYYPYGPERSVAGGVITDKLFTGQQREPEAVSALGLHVLGSHPEGARRRGYCRTRIPSGSPRSNSPSRFGVALSFSSADSSGLMG
jgi:hypothetical protein